MSGIRIKTAFASQPFWQQLLLVFIFNTLIAVLLHIFIPASRFINLFIDSQIIGLSFMLSVAVTAQFIRLRNWRIIIPLLAGACLGVVLLVIFHAIRSNATLAQVVGTLQRDGSTILSNYLFPALFFGTIIVIFFAYREKILRTRSRLQAEQILNLDYEKKFAESHLRLLQAQIEPHFLFNTLSNVISLIEREPQKSKRLLELLTDFLRSSLKRSTRTRQALGDEIELIENYLAIMKIRMGERLDYQIHFTDEVLDGVFPPLLLQPLVENAIIHGIEPTASGGRIEIEAARDKERLIVQVSDNGRGLPADNLKGFGLSNVRDRIKSFFGDTGTLTIEEQTPHGVRVTIEVPYATV